MQPVFPRIDTAIFSTLEYYGMGRIRDTIARISKPESISSTPHILDSWLELLYGSHKDMEAEIQQTIFTSNQNMLVELFDYIHYWSLDWRMQGIDIDYIQAEIEKINAKTYDNFFIKIESEVIKFQQTPNFINLEHLEEIIDPETRDSAFYRALRDMPDSPFKKKYNYKYYCIKEIPALIDTSYVAEYASMTNPIFDNFRSILIKYLTRYNEGKIVASTQVVIEKLTLPSSNETLELPAPDSTTNPKLKTNLSVPQLSYLFKMLMDSKPDIFDVKSKAEVYRFINANFTTIGKDEGPTVASLNNLYSNVDKDVANFWGIHLKKMVEHARKI